MCARHGKGAIEIGLSEKGALAKKRLGNTGIDFRAGLLNWRTAVQIRTFQVLD